jgi:hypothetical protein
MLNRRHLRIKILHVLYAFYQDDEQDVTKTKKALDHSIKDARALSAIAHDDREHARLRH